MTIKLSEAELSLLANAINEARDDAMRFWETNRGQAFWGKWRPHWEESYQLKVGTQGGYYTKDGRILTYWD